MLDWQITSHHPSDMLGTSIRYCLADLYNTYTMYHPLDVHWHVLNDTMSQYYLCHYWIFELNALVFTQNLLINSVSLFRMLFSMFRSEPLAIACSDNLVQNSKLQ